MEESPVVLHQGIYRPVASLSSAVFMITGMTIGAGVLGIPYVIAQVGVKVGVLYLVLLGAVILTLNLMLGEVVARTKEPLQLPGLAQKYLGNTGRFAISLSFVGTSLGAIVAYLIGEGQTLSALFGGAPIMWTLIFWAVGTTLVAGGLRRVSKYEKILSGFVIASIVILSFFLLGHVQTGNWQYTNMASIFLPYGVILFALHGTSAIAEAEALLPGQPEKFKKAVLIGTLIPIVLYILFALAVVGVKGVNTTQVATLSLAREFGLPILVFANLFATVAMATAFMGMSTAFVDSLVWDFKLRRTWAVAIVAVIPLLAFFWSGQNFVMVLNIVGGMFVGIEAILIALMFWRARAHGDLTPHKYVLRHVWLFLAVVLLVFSFSTITAIGTMASRFK